MKIFKISKLFFLITTLVITNIIIGCSNADTNNITAKATTTYQWNNTIPEKKPTSQDDNGKLVLFDNSHAETAGSADWVIDGAFSDFADTLVKEGYTVKEYRGIDKNGDSAIRFYDDRKSSNVELNEAIITYNAIKNADVFVIAEANRPFRKSEYDALKKFVDAGKGIFFISDHYNADRNKNTWDSTEVFNGYNRSTDSKYNMGGVYGDLRNPQNSNKGWLSQNFGLRFRFNGINCKSGVSGIKSIIESEGITKNVNPILMAAGSTLAITDNKKAKGIIYFASNDNVFKWNHAVDTGIYYGGEDEGAYVAISKPSAGKAAFIGDSSPIEDITPKYKSEENGKKKQTYNGFIDSGNAAVLSINIINWLAKQENYVGFDGINHPKGVLTPNPMADVEKNTPQSEPWDIPDYDPWDTNTFAYGSYGASNGPDSNEDDDNGNTPSTTNLFFSEYIEGSGNNKALEIYNGTGSSVDLSKCVIEIYSNGNTNATHNINLKGTITNGDVYVVANNSANSSILAQADLKTDSVSYNGNDAVVLKNNGIILDVIGQVGYNPTTEWGSGNTSTKDNTLVRKANIISGDTNATDRFDPLQEWDGFPINTFSNLGKH